MFEKVLVCLDGSRNAEEILPYIAEEGEHFGEILLLRVAIIPDVPVLVGVPGAPGVPVRTEGMLKSFEKGLAEAEEYLLRVAEPWRARGWDVDCAVRQGVASEVIMSYARERGVKLIAMATHGHGGLRRAIVGSTADAVLRNSGLPVLIVTPGGAA